MTKVYDSSVQYFGSKPCTPLAYGFVNPIVSTSFNRWDRNIEHSHRPSSFSKYYKSLKHEELN